MGSSIAPRWIASTALGEMLALGTTTLLGVLVASAISEGSAFLALGMVFAGAVEGAIVGACQALILGLEEKGRWIRRTAGAFTAAWAVGAAVSFLEPGAPAKWQILVASLLFGVLLGVFIGFAQGMLLHASSRARRQTFVITSAAAWGAAFAAAALLSELVPWGAFTALVWVIECFKAASVGVIAASLSLGALPRRLRSAPEIPD